MFENLIESFCFHLWILHVRKRPALLGRFKITVILTPCPNEVMDQLIDAYRTWFEDDHKYRRDDHGLYVGGTRWRIPRAFLDKAEAQMGKGQQGEVKRSGILPYILVEPG
jgi:hypothetical protein